MTILKNNRRQHAMDSWPSDTFSYQTRQTARGSLFFQTILSLDPELVDQLKVYIIEEVLMKEKRRLKMLEQTLVFYPGCI